MEWNSDLNQADLDGRTRSYGARKRGDLFSLIKPSITFKFCTEDETHLPRSRM